MTGLRFTAAECDRAIRGLLAEGVRRNRQTKPSRRLVAWLEEYRNVTGRSWLKNQKEAPHG